MRRHKASIAMLIGSGCSPDAKWFQWRIWRGRHVRAMGRSLARRMECTCAGLQVAAKGDARGDIDYRGIPLTARQTACGTGAPGESE